MNRAVSVPQSHQPGAMEQVSYLTSLERTQPTMSQMPSTAQPRMEVRFNFNLLSTFGLLDCRICVGVIVTSYYYKYNLTIFLP